MGSTEETIKLNKDLHLNKSIVDSNKNLGKVTIVERHAIQSTYEKNVRVFSKNESMLNENETNHFTNPETYMSPNQILEGNTIGTKSDSANLDSEEWQKVLPRYKKRQNSKNNKQKFITIGQNENKLNFLQYRKRAGLKSSVHPIYLSGDNSRKQTSIISSDHKIKIQSKNSPLNVIKASGTCENSKDYSFKNSQSTHSDLSKTVENHTVKTHKKLNVGFAKLNSTNETLSEVFNSNDSRVIENGSAKSSKKCEVQKRVIFQTTKESQTDKVEGVTFNSVIHAEKCLRKKPKKNKLIKKGLTALKPEITVLEDEIRTDKANGEMSTGNVIINQMCLNEYVDETVSSNHKNCELFENGTKEESCSKAAEDTLTFSENMNEHPTHVEDIYDYNACSLGLTGNVNIARNGEPVFPYCAPEEYYLHTQPISIFSLDPYIANSMFLPQIYGYPISEIPEQNIINDSPCTNCFREEFQNDINQDQAGQNQEFTSGEKSSENVEIPNRDRSNFFCFYNSNPNFTYRPRVLTRVYKGMVHYQYYPDFPPVPFLFIPPVEQNVRNSP